MDADQPWPLLLLLHAEGGGGSSACPSRQMEASDEGSAPALSYDPRMKDDGGEVFLIPGPVTAQRPAPPMKAGFIRPDQAQGLHSRWRSPPPHSRTPRGDVQERSTTPHPPPPFHEQPSRLLWEKCSRAHI